MFNAKAKDIENDIRQLIPEAGTMQNNNNSSLLRREEIVVIVRRVTMGMGSRNPIERVILIQSRSIKVPDIMKTIHSNGCILTTFCR